MAAYRALQLEGLRPDDAAIALRSEGEKCSRTSLDRWAKGWDEAGWDGLLDRREHSGRRRSSVALTDAEAATVRARVLATTNRTADTGSIPEALRQASRRGELRPEIAQEFKERDRDGRGVPAALRRELGIAPAVVRQLRGPTEAGLDYLQAPGSLMWVDDERTGSRRFVRVGDVLEADDATVNFYVCIPWELGGDPCSETYGVRVARCQWLVAIDRASRFIPGWSYTMRPRDSYRAEDILSLFHGLFRQHGVWSRLCLERGAWESASVEAMMDGLGIKRITAYTPHQKPYIEGLFNVLWTKLASMPGQVGRFRGEEEKAAQVVRSCQRGATDPRTFFPMLSDAIEAFRRASAERNQTAVHSEQYGSWVPEERWLAQQAEAKDRLRLRALNTESAWMFAPVSREWTVNGGTVGGVVQIMEGLSVRFDFTAEWLPNFDGCRVRAHFDPAAPDASATLVLLDNCRDHQSGSVLGQVVQINETASYARSVMGWAMDDREAGREQRLRNAAALRREVRTILPGGDTGLSVTDLRDGTGRQVSIESALPTPSATASAPDLAPARRREKSPIAAPTQDEFARAAKRRAALLCPELSTDDA